MKIQISKKAVAGTVEIPAGDYWVSLLTEASQINLSGSGKDFKIPATCRNRKAKTKTTNVAFYCGGGSTWSLVVSTPKYGEWVAMLDLKAPA